MLTKPLFDRTLCLLFQLDRVLRRTACRLLIIPQLLPLRTANTNLPKTHPLRSQSLKLQRLFRLFSSFFLRHLWSDQDKDEDIDPATA